ncbi:MAG: PqqD family protein [bacterium]
MNIIQRYKLKRKQNFFDMTPVRNYEHEINDKGIVVVLIPRFDNHFVGKWLNKISSKKEIRTDLDESGSKVWLLIDGKRTVYDIFKVIKSEGILDLEQAQERIVTYLRMLYNNGLIEFKEFKKGKNN